jgi:hypothetical protein
MGVSLFPVEDAIVNALPSTAKAGSALILLLITCVSCATRLVQQPLIGLAEAPAAVEEQAVTILRAFG